MQHDEHLDEEDFDGLEASLKSLRPRALPTRFTEDVVVESFLSGLTPRDLPADFADVVASESALAALKPQSLPEGFADRVAAEITLRELTPVALPEGFVDRVSAEIALRGLTPRELPAGFVERVVAASSHIEQPAGRLIAFRRLIVPLSAAAALALAAIPFALRNEKVTVAAPTVVAASANTPAPEPLAEADSVSLPVVSLPDGRAYRPVIRNRYVQPVDFQMTPAGIAIPVAAQASGTGVDYEPVMFE